MRGYMHEDVTLIMRLVYRGSVADDIDELDEDDWPDVPQYIVTRLREDFTRLRLQSCNPKTTNIRRGREAGSLELIWDTTRSSTMYHTLEKRVNDLESSDLDVCGISLLQVYDLWPDSDRIPKSVQPILQVSGSSRHGPNPPSKAAIYAMVMSAFQNAGERAAGLPSTSSTPSFLSSPATQSSMSIAGPSSTPAVTVHPVAVSTSASTIEAPSSTSAAGTSSSAVHVSSASTADSLGSAPTTKSSLNPRSLLPVPAGAQVPNSSPLAQKPPSLVTPSIAAATTPNVSTCTSSTGSPFPKAPPVPTVGIPRNPNSTATPAKAQPVGRPLSGTSSSAGTNAEASKLPTTFLTPSNASQTTPKARQETPVDSLVASMTTAYVKAAGRTSISPSPARFPITRQQPFGSGNLDTSAQNTPAKPPAAEKPVLKVATGGLAGAAASQPVFGKPGWSAGASPSSAKGTATPARSGPSTPSAQGTSIFTGTSSTTAVSAKPPSRAPPLASDAHGGGSPNVAASAPKAATAPSNAPPALVAEKPAQRERETGGIIGGTAINQPMFGKPGWSVIASPTSTKSTAAPTTSATTSHTVFAPASSSTGAPTAPGSSSVVDTTLAPATSSVPQPNTDVPPTLKQPPSTSWLVPAEGPSHALHAVSADAHPAQHVLSHERILKWTSILESAKKAKDDADRALAVATEEVTRKRKREDEVTERLVRLRTEAPGSHLGEAESKPDVLDAVAALEAQVNEMRTVLMIERSARQAAEQTLASERRVLEDVRRECREPFVVPALLDAFIKLSRMGEGAMEVTMEVDEQIVS